MELSDRDIYLKPQEAARFLGVTTNTRALSGKLTKAARGGKRADD